MVKVLLVLLTLLCGFIIFTNVDPPTENIEFLMPDEPPSGSAEVTEIITALNITSISADIIQPVAWVTCSGYVRDYLP